MNTEISYWEAAGRIGAALLFGFVIGWERESKRKPAGLRTQMLVALGCSTFTLLALDFSTTLLVEKKMNVDPMRILNGIMEGLGFLGGGTIIQSRGSVEGITTAATIWVVGAVGLACGSGNIWIGAMATVLTFFVLTAFRLFEKHIVNRTEA